MTEEHTNGTNDAERSHAERLAALEKQNAALKAQIEQAGAERLELENRRKRLEEAEKLNTQLREQAAGAILDEQLRKAADGWTDLLPDPVHAVISMQSLHDLGDETAVDRIYRLVKSVLTRGGMFLNADLTTPEKPGRFSVQRHLARLQNHGYTGVACTLQSGSFVCVIGFVDVAH